MATAAARAGGRMLAMGTGTRGRAWRCACGKQLGEKVLVKGGYARLVIDFATARRVEVCGHEVRVTCPKCHAVKTWHTSATEAQSA